MPRPQSRFSVSLPGPARPGPRPPAAWWCPSVVPLRGADRACRLRASSGRPLSVAWLRSAQRHRRRARRDRMRLSRSPRRQRVARRRVARQWASLRAVRRRVGYGELPGRVARAGARVPERRRDRTSPHRGRARPGGGSGASPPARRTGVRRAGALHRPRGFPGPAGSAAAYPGQRPARSRPGRDRGARDRPGQGWGGAASARVPDPSAVARADRRRRWRRPRPAGWWVAARLPLGREERAGGTPEAARGAVPPAGRPAGRVARRAYPSPGRPEPTAAPVRGVRPPAAARVRGRWGVPAGRTSAGRWWAARTASRPSVDRGRWGVPAGRTSGGRQPGPAGWAHRRWADRVRREAVVPGSRKRAGPGPPETGAPEMGVPETGTPETGPGRPGSYRSAGRGCDGAPGAAPCGAAGRFGGGGGPGGQARGSRRSTGVSRSCGACRSWGGVGRSWGACRSWGGVGRSWGACRSWGAPGGTGRPWAGGGDCGPG